jgi:hypothetical protein
MSGAHGSRFTVRYVDPASAGGSGAVTDSDVSMEAGGSLAAAFVNSGSGTVDVALWKPGDALAQRRGALDLYRLELDHSLRRLVQVELPGSSGPTVNPTVLAGDVDVSSSGSEIVVVGGEASGRTRVCAFGGMGDGGLHLVGDFYLPRRAVGSAPSVPSIGDVVGDTKHAGSEIIVGGQRGRVYAVGLTEGRASVLSVLRAFPDRPRATAQRLAVGDLIADNPGDEIVVGDDGTVGDGLVRIFDGRTQRALAEFEAFSPGMAPAGVELWVGDVMADPPGAELIVGQGSAGGSLRVFTLASGVPMYALDVPDPLSRTAILHGQLAIGNLLPELDGNEIAVAHGASSAPVQVFNFNADRNHQAATLQLPADMEAVTAIATTH